MYLPLAGRMRPQPRPTPAGGRRRAGRPTAGPRATADSLPFGYQGRASLGTGSCSPRLNSSLATLAVRKASSNALPRGGPVVRPLGGNAAGDAKGMTGDWGSSGAIPAGASGTGAGSGPGGAAGAGGAGR